MNAQRKNILKQTAVATATAMILLSPHSAMAQSTQASLTADLSALALFASDPPAFLAQDGDIAFSIASVVLADPSVVSQIETTLAASGASDARKADVVEGLTLAASASAQQSQRDTICATLVPLSASLVASRPSTAAITGSVRDVAVVCPGEANGFVQAAAQSGLTEAQAAAIGAGLGQAASQLQQQGDIAQAASIVTAAAQSSSTGLGAGFTSNLREAAVAQTAPTPATPAPAPAPIPVVAPAPIGGGGATPGTTQATSSGASTVTGPTSGTPGSTGLTTTAGGTSSSGTDTVVISPTG